MHVTLTDYHESTKCSWCEKEKEGVTVCFDDGFLEDLPVCWSCLQKAVKVRSRQENGRSQNPPQIASNDEVLSDS